MRAVDYLDQLKQLLPPGPAFPRDEDTTFNRLLGAIAEEFGRFDARVERLPEEADPRTALELLPDWERVAGLPDVCTGTIATTVPERRAAIVAKITARGGQSLAYLTSLAANLGYAVVISEYRPLRARFRAGSRCHSVDWAFAFKVEVLAADAIPSGALTDTARAISNSRFRAGRSRSGERLRTFGNAALECTINRAKPAHSIAIFAYPDPVQPAFDFDFTNA